MKTSIEKTAPLRRLLLAQDEYPRCKQNPPHSSGTFYPGLQLRLVQYLRRIVRDPVENTGRPFRRRASCTQYLSRWMVEGTGRENKKEKEKKEKEEEEEEERNRVIHRTICNLRKQSKFSTGTLIARVRRSAESSSLIALQTKEEEFNDRSSFSQTSTETSSLSKWRTLENGKIVLSIIAKLIQIWLNRID